MSTTIYNEGRVVGYSAYEQYVKQALAQDPNTDPASEREWLASTIANGSSMLLKVTASDDLIRDFFLPSNTRLCAANMIVASFFVGEGHFATNDDIWADRIASYGNLLANSNDNHPSGNVSATDNVPIVNPIPDNYEADLKKQLMQYIKISDGIVIQPGTWADAGAPDNSPKMKLSPDLTSSGYPRIRLSFKSPIITTFYILFTGFTNRVVIQGTSGISTSANTPSPQDGDFLGPATYPWSNKIIFSTPAVLTYYLKTGIHPQSGTDIGTGPWDNVKIHQNDDATEVGIEVQKQISAAGENVFITPKNNRHQRDVRIEVRHKLTPRKTNIVMNPIDNTHAANTIIDVRNNIHTNGAVGSTGNEFIKVTQTADQSDTGIEVIPSNLITPGLGIGVTTDPETGVLSIQNLFPYYNDESNRIRIYPKTDTNPDTTNAYYDLATFHNWRTGYYNALGFNALDVQLNPGVDQDGNMIACAISLATNHDYRVPWEQDSYFAKLMNPNILKNVRLNHSNKYWIEDKDTDGVDLINCILGRIRFYDGNNKYKLATILKDAAKSSGRSYAFLNTTQGGSGVWNICIGSGFTYDDTNSAGRPTYRGLLDGCSWNVYAGLVLVTENMIAQATAVNSKFFQTYVKNKVIQAGDIMIITVSIADGYNDQFYRRPYPAKIGSGQCMFSVDTNLTVNGLIYKL